MARCINFSDNCPGTAAAALAMWPLLELDGGRYYPLLFARNRERQDMERGEEKIKDSTDIIKSYSCNYDNGSVMSFYAGVVCFCAYICFASEHPQRVPCPRTSRQHVGRQLANIQFDRTSIRQATKE